MRKTYRERRSSWIDITLSILVFSVILVGIFFVFTVNKNLSSSPAKKSNVVEYPIVTDTIDSNYPGIKIITEISNDPYTPFALQYPQSVHNSFNDEIKTYIKEARDNYLTKMAHYKQSGGEFSGELNISFETFPHHSGMYSFVLVNSTFLGGANGSTEIVSFRLNPDTGQKVTIEDLFEHDKERLHDVSSAVRDYLFTDDSLKDYLFLDEVHLHTEPRWENFQNFALTGDSIIFYFDEYEIAAGAAGVPIVPIPLNEFTNLIAKGYLKSEIVIPEKSESEKTVEKPDTEESKEDSTTEEIEKSNEENNLDEEITLPEPKRVALTFDDGPDPKVTTQILETLKKYDAKATFFMLGSRVEFYPEIAKNVETAGHELGNHTWTHPNLTKASIKKINSEITRTSTIIEKVTGKKATSFRPPYGAVNNTVRGQTKLPVILWDVDTLDWKHRNANQLLAQVKKSTRDGSVILMHDIHQSTADGLDAVLAYLESEGYTFVTVSEIN